MINAHQQLILRLMYYMIFSGKSPKDIREYDDEDEDILDSSNNSRHSIESEVAAQSVDGKKKSDWFSSNHLLTVQQTTMRPDSLGGTRCGLRGPCVARL